MAVVLQRKDDKGRNLHTGEFQMPDGRYRFKYTDSDGKRKVVYSMRLTPNDLVPPGCKKTPSLREMEKDIQRKQFDHVSVNGGNYSVLELVEKYIQTRTNVKKTTVAGYGTVVNLLKEDPFGRKRIDKILKSDAMNWFIKLQQKDGKGYSSIHTIRGVLRPAFALAVDDDLIRKNPFDFVLADVIVDDSVRREAISREEERKFLEFVKNDKHFCRYYEGIYILFKTGLRISEFCGLTLSDISFKEHTISVSHQLHKRGSTGYYVEWSAKTESGVRVLPMSKDVEDCFKTIIKNRRPPEIEPSVDGLSGFLYFDKDGSICYSLHWEHYFKHILDKYNSIYKVQMPKVTPHVCRHTYCSNMAKSGMNPKTLQYLMGHADISVTLNTYTHVKLEDAREEIARLETGSRAEIVKFKAV